MIASAFTTITLPRFSSLLPPPPSISCRPITSKRRLSTISNLSLSFSGPGYNSNNHNHNHGSGGGGSNNNDNNNQQSSGGGGSENEFGLFLFLFLSQENQSLTSLHNKMLLFIISSLSTFGYFQSSSALAKTNSINNNEVESDEFGVVWEVSGGRRVKLVVDELKDSFVIASGDEDLERNVSVRLASDLWVRCRDVAMRLMLPEGYPESVTSDYMEYSLWRGVQGIAAQVSGVLATQSLLYAVGLGKGAIPTAAAVNWVLKDGIGYVSKIFLSKFGRHFDVNPKGWRLFADFLENAAFGLEILTPTFPHLFVPIGAVAGAGRSAAALIQAATRSCFYAGFAAQRNFAEVIAKGEAQGMVSKFIGIGLGIGLANYTHNSTPLALATFGIVTGIHMFCNLKSYQAIQLRTLNPYRASLVFSEYLLSGLVPSVKEVNDEEPFFPALPLPILKSSSKGHSSEVLSSEAKDAAANIEARLQLGSKLSNVIENEDDARALFDLYKDVGYMLTEHEGRYCVILKESCSPKDMLKSLFHVNYLYWLEKNAGINSKGPLHDCSSGGKLRISLEYVEREFNHVKSDGEMTGWTTDTLIARPLPNRIRPGGDFS